MEFIRTHLRIILWVFVLLPAQLIPPFVEGYLQVVQNTEMDLPDWTPRRGLYLILAVETILLLRWTEKYVKGQEKAGVKTRPSLNQMFGPYGAKITFEYGLKKAWQWKGAYWVQKRRNVEIHKQYPKWARQAGWTIKLPMGRTIMPGLHGERFDHNNDWCCRINPGRYALSIEKMEAQAMLLAGSIDGCVEARADRDRGTVGKGELRLWWSNPLARKTTLADLTVVHDSLMLSYGARRDGVAMIRKDRSLLIGGMTGQGKSNLIWVLLACLLAAGEWINLYVADNKGGIELPALEEFAGKLSAGPKHKVTGAKAGHVYDPVIHKGDEGKQMGRLKVVCYVSDEDGSDTIELLLPKAVADMKVRRAWQRRTPGQRKLERGTQENPLCIVIIDEITLIDEELAKKTRGNLGKLLTGGRASLFVVWMCTQDARVETIPSSLRTLIPSRISFKTDGPEASAAIFNREALTRGATPHLFHDTLDQGLAISGSETSTAYSQVRVPYVGDDAIAHIKKGEVPPEMVKRTVSKTIATVPYQKYRYDNTSAEWVKRYGKRPAYIGINHNGPTKDGKIRTWEDRADEHMKAGEARKSPEWAYCQLCGQVENWFAKHCDPNDPDVTVTVVDIEEGEQEARKQERRDIRVLHPVFNTQHNGNKRTLGEKFTGWRELRSPARQKELVAVGAVGVDDTGDPVLPEDDGVEFNPEIDDLDSRAPYARQPLDGAWSE